MFSDSVMPVYQKFYAQRAVLKGAPQLTIDADRIGMAEFPVSQALSELGALASYLLGRKDISKMSFPEKLKAVQDAYGSQPFWRELLLDYLEMTLKVREEEIDAENAKIRDQMQTIMDEVNEQDAKREALIEHYAEKIQKEKFHVDAKALVRNYLKMLKRDEKKAWEVLITNPAYFSPIRTKDESGNVILTPAQAVDENERLGRFLKHLKG